MDRPAPAPPQHRDIVYCHGCENEWYRDEGGLECPECHSDFTEIVEPDHDPRDDDMHIPADDHDHPLHDHNPWNAPDPDEDDIDQFHFQRNEPGQPLGGTYRATINRTIDLNAQGQPIGGQGQGGGGIMGLIGNALGGMLGPALQQYQQQQRGQGMPASGEAQGRPGSAPGSPRGEQQQQQQQQQGNDGTFRRTVQGPGYSFTITSTTGGGNMGSLFPRNANGPQPFQEQPDHMDDMLRQMMQNIGVFPRLPGAGGQRQGPGGFMFDEDNMQLGGPMGFPPALLGLLGMGGGGVHGDAVYSQEALDRIVSQLMEQHQTGNAPGPASESAINSLPSRQLTQEDFGDDGKADCSICMEDKQLGDSVTVLPCGHWFDKECVREWLTTHDTCPHCRQGIMPKEQQGSSPSARQPSQPPLHDMTNPPVPGGFPNANAGPSSGSGTRDSPFNLPDSPVANRSNPANSQGSNGGVFGSMRNAFGGGGGNNNNNNGGRS